MYNLQQINLTKLFGSKHFTFPCKLSKNGHAVTTYSLVDTGANGFSFVNTSFAISLAKFLNIKAKRLVRPIPIKGYNGQYRNQATHFLILNLTIDKHYQTDIPCVILDLGNHDLILGLQWMSKYGIWLNPKDRTIIWPEDQEKHVPFHRDIIISSQELRRLQPQAINQKHQNDVRRREEAFDLEDKRRLDGRRSPVQILKHISPDLGRTTQEAPTL